jgi:DNA-binding PadR family transcriptional regulator
MTARGKRTGPLSYNAAMVLQAMVQGHRYGFELMKVSDLPSGTVYPLLRRLEGQGLVRSQWEDEQAAHDEGRPARRYYEATAEGETALAGARERIAAQQAALFGGLAGESRGRG